MPRPKGRSVLTGERIVSTALGVVDRDGLDGLSMRKLAGELGVDPMSIYHHIPNKEALLRALVEQVFASMAVPSQNGDWKRRVHRWAETYRGITAAHPNLVLRIVSDPATVAVAAVHVNESLYAAIEASGLPSRMIVRAADLIVDYVNGYALAFAPPIVEGVDARAAFKAELDARPPEHTATQRRLFADTGRLDHRDSFRFGLDVILAGLDQLRPRPTRSPERQVER
jgi:TetR/AcrR family tetracycline transcriptional repressor